MNPVQQSLTLVNRREPVFSKGNSHQVFRYTSFSNDEQFSSKFFEESFFCVPNYTSNNHRLESAGLNALEELLRCWECTEKIVKQCSMCILKLDVFGYFA